MNKIQIGTSLVAILLSFTMLVQAQELPIAFGVKTGMNLSNMNVSGYSTDSKVGFNVGLTMDIALPVNGLSIMSGVEFTTKGFKDMSQTQRGITVKVLATSDAMYLQLPIHLALKTNISPKTKLFVKGGPYFAYGIGGKTKIEGLTMKGGGQTITIGYDAMMDMMRDLDIDLSQAEQEGDTFDKNGGLKRFDAGIGCGVGMEFSQISVTIGYDLGLTNISRDTEKYKNQNAYLSLGYKF